MDERGVEGKLLNHLQVIMSIYLLLFNCFAVAYCKKMQIIYLLLYSMKSCLCYCHVVGVSCETATMQFIGQTKRTFAVLVKTLLTNGLKSPFLYF